MNVMHKLEEMVHSSYEDLFRIDTEGSIYNVPEGIIDRLTPRVIDKTTFFTIDAPQLFNVLNHTQTRIGAATLYRSLYKPLDSTILILEKQKAVKEIDKNKKSGTALQKYLKRLAKREPYLHMYLFNCKYCHDEPFLLKQRDQYRLYYETTEFLKDMVIRIKDLSCLESPYTRILIEDIRNLEGTRVFDLIKGPVYRTPEALLTNKEVNFYTPRVKLTLRSIKPTLIIPYPMFALLWSYDPLKYIALFGFMAYSGFFWGYPDKFDIKYFISPLREIYKNSSDIGRSIQAVGMLDELLSFYKYSNSMKCDMVLPKVTQDDTHYFQAKKVRNPVLAKGNPNFVPNDVRLDKKGLSIITGANSGGKTTYCKTISQMQLLAQIGCYVPAEEAELGIADKILYQSPISDSIMDAEGRFGTELKRTKDIFFKTTPKSLVVLDELVEATTYEEKMEISRAIMDGFSKIGSTTILVTHNHELAAKLHQEGKSYNLQVEFKKNKPTYRIIPGVAKESHAELVAEKLGFSSKDIDKYLRKEGYLE
jgi:hypothetical protein